MAGRCLCNRICYSLSEEWPIAVRIPKGGGVNVVIGGGVLGEGVPLVLVLGRERFHVGLEDSSPWKIGGRLALLKTLEKSCVTHYPVP